MTPFQVKLRLGLCLSLLVLVGPTPVLSAILPEPAEITSISPTSGPIGTIVTIHGQHLGRVYFPCEIYAPSTFVSDVEITTVVPAHAVTGRIMIFPVLPNEVEPMSTAPATPSEQIFTVPDEKRSPIITSVVPTSGQIGTLVKIYGHNLFMVILRHRSHLTVSWPRPPKHTPRPARL